MLKSKFAESDKLMVINLLYLGDLIFSLPLLKEIKKQRSQVKLSLAANDNFACLLQEADFVDELVGFDKSANLFSALNSAIDLRKKNYNISLNIHGNWRSTLLQRLACPGYRAGFDRSGQKLFLSFTRKWQPEKYHIVDYQLQWLDYLGLEIPEKAELPELKPASSSIESVKALLAGNLSAASRKKYVILNSGGSWPSKRWSPKKFAELGRLILQETKAGVVLTGSEEDEERNNQIIQEILHLSANNILEDKILNSAGLTSIPQLLALIDMSELVVSGDTGPVHVAALTNTPLIALFGPSSEENYRPYSSDDITRVITNKEINCRPCGEHNCPEKHHNCLENISVEDVWEEFLEIWQIC